MRPGYRQTEPPGAGTIGPVTRLRTTAGLLMTGGALLASVAVTACHGPVIACAGQCSAPYTLEVIFRPHTTPAAARSALRQCSRPDPDVIRIGPLRYQGDQFYVTIHLHHQYTRLAGQDSTLNCLNGQPQVLGAAWPG